MDFAMLCRHSSVPIAYMWNCGHNRSKNWGQASSKVFFYHSMTPRMLVSVENQAVMQS